MSWSKIFLALVLSAFSLFAAGYSYSSENDESANAGFFFGANANYASPARLSATSYQGAWGEGGRIGICINGLKGFVGGSFFLSLDKDAIKLKNYPQMADIYHSYFGAEAVLFGLKYGVGIGGLKLAVPQNVYDAEGKSTLTELRGENRMVQLSKCFWLGAKIPIPVENDFWNRWSIDYEYRMISADRAWMFWHDVLSSAIMTTSYDLAHNVAKTLAEKGQSATSLLVTAASVGLIFSYWYYDYDYHHWPFRDESPFRLHRHAIVLNFEFKKWANTN